MDSSAVDHKGRVIAAHGRHYLVETEKEAELITCYPRGKRSDAAVGDYVKISRMGSDEGTIEEIMDRKTLLYRSDEVRQKLFAANVDQVIIVIATEPQFSTVLLGRAILAANTAGVQPIVVLNKADLTNNLDLIRKQLEWVKAINIPLIELSAVNTKATVESLMPILRGKTSILLGQSAMGKSTILNALVPEANAATQEHSQALGAGRHTTTSTKMYHLPDNSGSIIDSPGFQGFGLHHLDDKDILAGFPEFYEQNQSCRFHNCTHRREPGCNVIARLNSGAVTKERYNLYKQLIEEFELQSKY